MEGQVFDLSTLAEERTNRIRGDRLLFLVSGAALVGTLLGTVEPIGPSDLEYPYVVVLIVLPFAATFSFWRAWTLSNPPTQLTIGASGVSFCGPRSARLYLPWQAAGFKLLIQDLTLGGIPASDTGTLRSRIAVLHSGQRWPITQDSLDWLLWTAHENQLRVVRRRLAASLGRPAGVEYTVTSPTK
jgi:hypothetical protein